MQGPDGKEWERRGTLHKLRTTLLPWNEMPDRVGCLQPMKGGIGRPRFRRCGDGSRSEVTLAGRGLPYAPRRDSKACLTRRFALCR